MSQRLNTVSTTIFLTASSSDKLTVLDVAFRGSSVLIGFALCWSFNFITSQPL